MAEQEEVLTPAEMMDVIKGLKAEVNGLQKKLSRYEKTDLKFTPMRPGSDVHYHLATGELEFCYTERIPFTNDSGYEHTAFYDRACGVVSRALGPNEQGNKLGVRIYDNKQVFDNIPPFDKKNYLEVTVRIVGQ